MPKSVTISGPSVASGAITHTVNYSLNPSFEVNVTDDWTFGQAGAGATINLDATQYKVGTKSARMRAGNNMAWFYTIAGVSVPNGATVSISCWMRCSADPTAGKAQLLGQEIGVITRITCNATVASNGAWEYLSGPWTNTTGVAKTIAITIFNSFSDSAADVWVDACQLELASAASAYTDGAQGEGHSWAGAAHNSVSTWTEPASVGFVTVIPYMMV